MVCKTITKIQTQPIRGSRLAQKSGCFWAKQRAAYVVRLSLPAICPFGIHVIHEPDIHLNGISHPLEI